MPGHSSCDNKSVIDEFHQVVNMTPKELESWLDTGVLNPTFRTLNCHMGSNYLKASVTPGVD